MTVKRQLTLLISLIICLPVFTALIIYGYYCNSSKRLLLSSYRRSPEKADVSLTSDDLNSIKKVYPVAFSKSRSGTHRKRQDN